MNGILLLLVQAIEVVGCIAIIIWAVHEIKMAHKELREIKREVKTIREDLTVEKSNRKAADRQIKKTIEMIVKHMRKLELRICQIEKQKK